MRKEKNIRKAFSLLELLVVIAVIALLAAICIPVVDSVRSSARRADSVHKLHSIGVAVSMYAAENNNEIVAWEMAGETSQGYCYFLAPYLWTGKATSRITMEQAWQGMASSEVPSEYRYYDGNMLADGLPGLTFASNAYFNYKQTATIPQAPKGRNVRMTDISDPAKVVHFVVGWAQFFTDAGQVQMTFPSQTTDPGVCARTERVYFPDGDTTPALFLDGSVRALEHPIERDAVNFWGVYSIP
ncbi:MAG: prepilin-type N-terminal cleavage/methylation domain-containing protein [Verrucomicrobiota bacterium JB024]|nr:prepilin-type N-terminal cleavage/methylation domain-containing protein [Verrucomicrobiota bacterium JB024]